LAVNRYQRLQLRQQAEDEIMISQKLKVLFFTGTMLGLSGCVTPVVPTDFVALREESPTSILVVPPLNNTLSVNAPEFFLSTVARPFGNRGYYVFPSYMVRKVLEENGLSDAGLVHSTEPTRLGRLFGCDSVLLIKINRWDSQYILLATTTTVSFDYELKSCKTNAVLWQGTQTMQYRPSQSNSGNAMADLIASAVTAAIQKAAPNYIPLAQQANLFVTIAAPNALPAGPFGLEAPKP
jgi:hypothetical protein